MILCNFLNRFSLLDPLLLFPVAIVDFSISLLIGRMLSCSMLQSFLFVSKSSDTLRNSKRVEPFFHFTFASLWNHQATEYIEAILVLSRPYQFTQDQDGKLKQRFIILNLVSTNTHPQLPLSSLRSTMKKIQSSTKRYANTVSSHRKPLDQILVPPHHLPYHLPQPSRN